MTSQSRRGFLKRSAGLASGATLAAGAPASVTAISSSRVLGANNRIRIGLIGCGGQGAGDLKQFLKIDGIQCVALSDVDTAQMEKTQSEALDPVEQKAEQQTQDFRRLLDRTDLDAVIVATPDHWHAIPTVMACQSGKDVYVEKPLALTIHEGRVMVDAARKYDRVVQVGTQQRSAPHFSDAVEYVKSGKLGKIRLVRSWAYLDSKGEMPVQPDGPPPEGVDYDLWLGPAVEKPFNPNRFHSSFRWYWDYSGGLMTDWGAHMIDIANWAMDVKAPRSAVSVGGKFGYPKDAMETPDTQQVIWGFDEEFSMVWEHALGVGRGPEARQHGVQFHGNEGVLVVDRHGWEVHPETDKIDKDVREFRTLGKPRHNIKAYADHLTHVENFVDCMRSRERPNADVEIGHNSVIACHLGNIAFRVGRRVEWDPDGEKVVGDREAARLVKQEYRSPWKL